MASSGPHQRMMGKAQSRQMLTEVRRDCGHPSTGPRAVRDQSCSRMRLAISLSPGKTCSSMGCVSSRCEPKAKRTPGFLFPDDLDQHPLGAAAVELAVEDLLPGAEVEPAAGDGDDDLAAHHLALVVGVGVVLAGAVVAVALRAGVERRQLLEPALVVLVQAGLVVVDEDARRDVHGVDQAEALAHAALGHRTLDG